MPIHPAAEIGAIHLRTGNMARALDFYQHVIGLRVLQQDEAGAWLGASVNVPLLRLDAFPDAVSRPPRTTGLYHFAILLPRRADLAVALRYLTKTGYPLQGASDHLVSEALYLSDPDGNGIEIYADRPRDQWPYRNGSLEMATIPLNVGDLMKEADSIGEPRQALPAASSMGHVHLHVGDLAEAERFYCDVLGFERMMRYGQSASFVSAGGYHHHIGLNTWAGVGAPPPPENAVGLAYVTLRLPDQAALLDLQTELRSAGMPFETNGDGLKLKDPFGNGLLITTSDSSGTGYAAEEFDTGWKLPNEFK